tara:strand:- start:360 stop:1595 length:1236 start_codon:yes stop_codon:yes gene_type:complete
MINQDRTYYHTNFIQRLEPHEVFVFGSNPKGRHGKGAAKVAQQFGAKYGQGRGLMGQSYGLVTKNLNHNYFERSTGITYSKTGERSVSPELIRDNIKELYEVAKNNPEKRFLIIYQYEEDPNGHSKKSLNGYTGKEMVDMFLDNQDIPDNIVFHISYKKHIEQKLIAQERQEQKRQEHISSTPKSKIENQAKFNEAMRQQKFLGLLRITTPQISVVPFFGSNNVFSQRHPSLFQYKGKQFISCEQFMMYSKAKLFGDEKTAFKILDLNEDRILAKNFIEGKISREDIINDKETLNQWNKIQQRIKELGREVKEFDEDLWQSKNISIITVANREKYNQNETLKNYLLETKNATIVEASPHDKYYGIGIGKDHPDITKPERWKGQNRLGYTLMNVRTILSVENKPQKKSKIKP